MSAGLLERLVLAKLYFDRLGLILAFDGDRCVGFVHAGFGPTDDGTEISTEMGVTCMLLTVPHEGEDATRGELLARGEDYLIRRGAQVLYGGGIRPLNPFYLGLYGGSELPGILVSDSPAQSLFRAAGYLEIDRTLVAHRELAGFRPVVDREQMLIRRRYQVEATFDPPTATWWDACTIGQTDRIRFDLLPRSGGPSAGSVTFWDMEPLASGWGVHAMGIDHLEIDESQRRRGLATFLVGEALRQLQMQGTTLVEVQAMQHNTAAIGLYRKLGFREVDQGVVFRKEC